MHPLNERIHQIEGLIRKTEALPDPGARALALELCQAVLGFHASALERLIEIISQTGEPCAALVNALAAESRVVVRHIEQVVGNSHFFVFRCSRKSFLKMFKIVAAASPFF